MSSSRSKRSSSRVSPPDSRLSLWQWTARGVPDNEEGRRSKSSKNSSSRSTTKLPKLPSLVSDNRGSPEKELAPIDDMWRDVTHRDGNRGEMILAVVPTEHVKLLERFVKNRKSSAKIKVASPDTLQNALHLPKDKEYSTLYLLVSCTVRYITYNIPETAKKVLVESIGTITTAEQDSRLYIGGDSRYCGVLAYGWQQLRGRTDRMLNHAEGISFDIKEHVDAVNELLANPRFLGSGSAKGTEGDTELQEKLIQGFDDAMQTGKAEAEAARRSRGEGQTAPKPKTSSTADEMNSSWFQKFKGIIALIVGGAAGVAGGCGGFWWAGAGGIFVKGPWGMYLAAGYFNMAAAGGIAIGAGGAALAAGLMVYFVPWGRVFEYLRHTMKWIWARVCEGVQWIWKKVREFASEVVSRASRRNTKKHHQRSWARHEI